MVKWFTNVGYRPTHFVQSKSQLSDVGVDFTCVLQFLVRVNIIISLFEDI